MFMHLKLVFQSELRQCYSLFLNLKITAYELVFSRVEDVAGLVEFISQ